MGATALRTFAACGLAFGFAGHGYAQETAPATAQDPATAASPSEIAAEEAAAEDGASEGTIVVTGSRIRRPNLESIIPVTTITGDEFFAQGQTNIGDTLNDLPQLRSTFAQQNPGAGVGIAGLNLLDLRGLGTVRTLVLVNGRRHVPADILNNASSPDVNTIPNDLIERVDIVTGGNSAVYGSDAIAGVVNFILRRDYNGIQVRGAAGVSEEGYGGNQYASIMAGHNFGDGRGNVTVHGEYARQERVYARDIPFLRQNDAFVTVDVDPGGLPQGSDGFADAVFFQNIRSATIHRYGLVAIPQPNTANADCGRGTLSNNGAPNNLGTAYHCNFIFAPDGTMIAQNGTRVGTGPGGTFIGGNGQNSREGTQLSILPFTERYNANLLAHYEFSPALEAFVEAKWTRVNAVGNQLGPTFLNNTTGSLGADPRIDPRLDNPFLNSAAAHLIRDEIVESGCGYALGTSLGTVTCRPLTAGELTALGPSGSPGLGTGAYRFLFARNLTDSPDRDEHFRRDTYRIVGGLRGTFNDDWNYELSVNYGKFKERTKMEGFVDRQRFLMSLDAAIDPLNPGAGIQCRAKFDPTGAAAPNINLPAAELAAKLAADIAACVPYNPFGGSDNSAAVNYFSLPLTNHSSIDQLDIMGFVSGDSSQLFELPGGPISFVLGGEYRRERANNNSDSAADTGISNSVFLGDVKNAKTKVKEAFAEVRLPLIRDEPFFEELTVSGAGRISDYASAVGTVKTYNAGFEWAPIRDIRFRGNYGRAVRAPNVSEAGFPSVPNFANNFQDPCAAAFMNTPVRAANCTAQLTAAQLANIQPAGFSLGIISGSNPNLIEETSDSYTIGAVIQPRWIPGLSLTVDWYKINVNNVIVTLAAQTIVNSCYDSPGLSSPLCGVFQRNLTGSPGPDGELPGQILNDSLVAGPQNFARRVRKGLDLEAAYRTNVTSNLALNTRLIYTHVFQNSNFENPVLPNFENRILSELGDPKDEFRWNVDLTLGGRTTIGYVMRYIGPMYVNGSTYENFNALPSACTTNTNPVVCPPLNSDAFEFQKYKGVFYHNLRFDHRIKGSGFGKDFNFYVGVDNLFDKEPPFGLTATTVGGAIYSIRGRNYYAGFKAQF